MAYEEQTGKAHPTIANGPRLPVGCDMLWTDFLELHSARGSSGFGPSPISFTDIDAWQRVTGARLSAWQIDAVRRADNAYFSVRAEIKQ